MSGFTVENSNKENTVFIELKIVYKTRQLLESKIIIFRMKRNFLLRLEISTVFMF